MARPHLRLNGGQYNLWRLSDQEFQSLGQHALPIVQNFELLQHLGLRCSAKGEPLSLGRALVVLERWFGLSSSWYDSYRSSFAFPLLLTFERKRRISYLLRCHDHRRTLYFPLYRVVSGDPSPAERARCHAPSQDDFSQLQMDDFIAILYGELLEAADPLREALVSPFFRVIHSDTCLYGYEAGRFFEYTYDSYERFCADRQRLEQRLGAYRPRTTSNRVERMIDRLVES
jgi:hypothetical protein